MGDALAQAYAQLGVIYGRAGLHRGNRRGLADAAALAPNDGRWPTCRGRARTPAQNETGGARTFERAYALDKTTCPSRVALATALLLWGAADRAGQLVEEYSPRTRTNPNWLRAQGDLPCASAATPRRRPRCSRRSNSIPVRTSCTARWPNPAGQGDAAETAAALPRPRRRRA